MEMKNSANADKPARSGNNEESEMAKKTEKEMKAEIKLLASKAKADRSAATRSAKLADRSEAALEKAQAKLVVG